MLLLFIIIYFTFVTIHIILFLKMMIFGRLIFMDILKCTLMITVGLIISIIISFSIFTIRFSETIRHTILSAFLNTPEIFFFF
jgi:hypothetical protein